MITQDKKHPSACHSGSLSRKLDLWVAPQRFGVAEELQAEKKTLGVSVAERALLPWQAAKDRSVQHAFAVQIVDVLSAPAQQPQVLEAFDGLPDILSHSRCPVCGVRKPRKPRRA